MEKARARLDADRIAAAFGWRPTTAASTASACCWAFLFCGGALLVIEDRLSIGAFVVFNTLVAMATQPLLTLLGTWESLQMTRVLVDRLNDLFEHPAEQNRDAASLHSVPSLEGRVETRGLGFRYGGPESPAILADIDLLVKPGRMVAVVGRSGSGKSTLVKCLAGLIEPTEGQILFDGVDLRTLDYRQLRTHVGMVPQRHYLFDDTIARNIAFGDVTPDLERVVWAARMANAHDFVRRLPLGYDTRIGESGLALSGGQQQRIAIARALYNRPTILILDEATSALDAESETVFQDNLASLATGRTVFIVAHRLSTVRQADTILVLDRGRLVERGTHEDLMSRRGLYFYLCSQQLGI